MRSSLMLLAIIGLSLAGCGGTPPATPRPVATLVASSTPPSDVIARDYSPFPKYFTADGFPALGDSSSSIEVIEYSSYDSRASLIAHNEIFAGLLPRIESGEIRYTFIPLSGTGSAANGIGAVQGALCAGEQGMFWAYHDQLFARLARQGDSAYTGSALLDIADSLGLDRAAWEACIASDSTAAVIQAASASAANELNYSGTPTILINGSYVLNELFSINEIIDQMVAQIDDRGQVAALPTPTGIVTEEPPERVILDVETDETISPPITIDLPADWQITLNDTLLLRDIDALRPVPYTVYKGPVTGGIGTIVLLWGFPNITTGNPMEAELGIATPVPNLWTDGLRLLRLAIVETGCNVGTDLQREYPIGGMIGTGTLWTAVDCPETPPTRGWFVGTQQHKLNFVFYVYIDPINLNELTDDERRARQEIQAILDTVTFLDPEG